MRTLVTGAAGFIGSRLALRLRTLGHEVIGVDSFTEYYDLAIKRSNARSLMREGVKFIGADLNVVNLSEILDDVDAVFHLAGQPGVRASWGSEFDAYTQSNISATQRLLEACRDRPRLKRLVFASSSSVYGDAESYPTTEMDRPQPLSPYGATKLAAEHLCTLYALSFGVPTVSLRYFTVYGPGQRPDMAFTRFTMAALSGDDICVFGSGEQVRDFTYVDDVVEANLLAATVDDVKPGAVFNVAGGTYSSINEVLQVLGELVGKQLSVVHRDSVAGDVERTGGDTTAIHSALNWVPRITLREGLSRQLTWASELPRPTGTNR